MYLNEVALALHSRSERQISQPSDYRSQNKYNTMQLKSRPSSSRDFQAYRVTINTSSFQYHQAPLKEKTQKELLPQYWRKFHMDQKSIVASKEDRLSKLTTKQIDRIIDMEKIKSLLYDKKRKVKEQYFAYNQLNNPNVHSNIYKANFLAKVNQIAIRRNIKPQSQIQDEQMDGDQSKLKEKERKINAPYEASKMVTIDSQKKQSSTNIPETDDIKSISSFSDDLELFEKELQCKRKKGNSAQGYRKSVKNEYKLIPSNRWFYGMSTHYLEQNSPDTHNQSHQCFRGEYDIESDVKESLEPHQPERKSFRNTRYSEKSNKSKPGERKVQPFGQFKRRRLVTID